MSQGKLLIIDDDPDVGALFGRIGRKQGFETMVVTRPEDFKAQWADFDPDAILLDIFMPETDGFEMLHYLGSEACRAQLILISGKDSHFLSSAKQLADAYGLRLLGTLSKPLHIKVMADMLDQVTPSRAPGEQRAGLQAGCESS